MTVSTPGGTSGAKHYTYDPVPTLSKVTPSAGKVIGGTVVTLTGSGFVTGSTTVTFGSGNHGTTVHVSGTTSLTVKAPGHAVATVTVSVSTVGGTSGTKHYTYDPVPTLSAVTPSAGKVVGGTVVTLTGSGFVTGSTTVTFGSGNHGTTVHVSSTTTLTVKAPGHAAATVTVSVSTPGGTSGTKHYTYDPVPTLSALTPAAGKTAGSTVVTLTGSGFVTGSTTVTFGSGNHGTTVHVWGTTSLTVKAPGHAAATVTVTVSTPGGTSGTKHYTYLGTPTLTKVTPAAGKLIGGTTVTLTGTGFFTGATTVTFGSGNHGTTVHVSSTTTLTVKAPGHAAATVTVTVSTPGGTSGTKHYTYEPAPTLTKVTPSFGKTAGGTVVTLTGTGFVTGSTTVTFGSGNHGTTVHVSGTTSLSVKAPGHTAATVTVSVTTPGGTSGVKPFVYEPVPTLSAVTPGAGPTAGGTTITLTGTGFVSGATTVTFGGTTIGSGSVTFVSSDEITVTSPSHAAGTVTVTATTPGGTSSAVHFVYGPPTLTKVTPATGPTSGDTTVTLTGTGFVAGATSVTFAGTPIAAGSVTFVSSTQIKVASPAHAAGQVTVTATTNGGTSSAAHFTYRAAPTLTKVTPATGPTSGGTTVTITGTNFATVTSVKFGNAAATSLTVKSTTQLSVVDPAGTAGTVSVSVTTAGGTATSASAFTYVGAAPRRGHRRATGPFPLTAGSSASGQPSSTARRPASRPTRRLSGEPPTPQRPATGWWPPTAPCSASAQPTPTAHWRARP